MNDAFFGKMFHSFLTKYLSYFFYWHTMFFQSHMHRNDKCQILITSIQEAQIALLKDSNEIRVMVLVWTVKRRNEGEQDTHLGEVYWAAPQGTLQITPSLTLEANHNFKASLCPISTWPWGQRQPHRKVFPLDALEMAALFLSDMWVWRFWSALMYISIMVSLDAVVRESNPEFSLKLLSSVTAESNGDYSLFLVFKKRHLPSPFEG